MVPPFRIRSLDICALEVCFGVRVIYKLSRKYVYRYYVGFSQEDDPADTRLITVNDSKPNLVILIGGQLRTAMD